MSRHWRIAVSTAAVCLIVASVTHYGEGILWPSRRNGNVIVREDSAIISHPRIIRFVAGSRYSELFTFPLANYWDSRPIKIESVTASCACTQSRVVQKDTTTLMTLNVDLPVTTTLREIAGLAKLDDGKRISHTMQLALIPVIELSASRESTSVGPLKQGDVHSGTLAAVVRIPEGTAAPRIAFVRHAGDHNLTLTLPEVSNDWKKDEYGKWQDVTIPYSYAATSAGHKVVDVELGYSYGGKDYVTSTILNIRVDSRFTLSLPQLVFKRADGNSYAPLETQVNHVDNHSIHLARYIAPEWLSVTPQLCSDGRVIAFHCAILNPSQTPEYGELQLFLADDDGSTSVDTLTLPIVVH